MSADKIAAERGIDDRQDAHCDLVTKWWVANLGHPDNRGKWKARALEAEATIARLEAELATARRDALEEAAKFIISGPLYFAEAKKVAVALRALASEPQP